MNESLTRFRIYFAWQDEKEAEWLRDMGKAGWRFERFRFGLYTFLKADPSDVVYQLDFHYDGRHDHEEYLQLFRDAGWELADEFAGWHYFRKPRRNGEYPRIYTDKEGYIRKYSRLLLVLLLTGLPSVYFALIWRLYPVDGASLFAHPAFTVLRVLLTIIACLVLFSILRVFMMIRYLKKQKEITEG